MMLCCGCRLKALAASGNANLRLITADVLSNYLLPLHISPAWRGATLVAWDGDQGASEALQSSVPSPEWMRRLWGWITKQHGFRFVELTHSVWPLVPVRGSQLASLSELATSRLLRPPADIEIWPNGLDATLQTLGSWCVAITHVEESSWCLINHIVGSQGSAP